MDFDLDEDQRALLDSARTLLDRRAGPNRARELGVAGHDDPLLAALGDAGFLDLACDAEAGPLSAVLVTEAIAAEVGRVNAGARIVVAPQLLGADTPARVALAVAGQRGPVRFGAYADVVLVLDGDRARAVEPRDAVPVASKFGYPFAYVDLDSGRDLGDGAGLRLVRWWRVALAAEAVGNMAAAHAQTVRYLGEREQFGGPLARFQALQHRLAETYISLAGARWLNRAAAWLGAPEQMAQASAGYAADAAQLLGTDLHQLTGAIGFTLEYDLHLWTTRLHALRVELGGARRHYADLAATRWAG